MQSHVRSFFFDSPRGMLDSSLVRQFVGSSSATVIFFYMKLRRKHNLRVILELTSYRSVRPLTRNYFLIAPHQLAALYQAHYLHENLIVMGSLPSANRLDTILLVNEDHLSNEVSLHSEF
jgi:hypothetical protein